MKNTTRHKHSWKLTSWLNKPEPNQFDDYLEVIDTCSSCGKTRKRSSTYEEQIQRVKELRCQWCNQFDVDHKDQTDCIKFLSSLYERVSVLENFVEQFRSVGRKLPWR